MPGRGSESHSQLTEKATEEVNREACCRSSKVPAKSSPSPVAPATGGPWQKKRGHPEGNQPSHVESHQRPGERIGARTEKDPGSHWWYPLSTLSAGSRPAFIQGTRSWPREKATWHRASLHARGSHP
ncbi:hypothetical protein GWK47_000211 [Chionoecetes opilio]|uniref:Uncharacterized protein n=1 Tax=Chionoecetes opilio TaxID=41210 RepID=A0A8J4XNQ2_CHIOP|nr:hypothetical protein GWK47_000211 [Chionoecetes opilio]